MNRREYISLLAGISLCSGCVDRQTHSSSDSKQSNQNKKVGVRLENNSPDEKTVKIQVNDDDGAEVFADSFTVEGDSLFKKEGLIEAGKYGVTVTIDKIGTKTTEWNMGGCDTNNIYVYFDEDALGISRTCSDD